MTGLVRKATFIVASGLLIASVAGAGVPSPANTTAPNNVNLIGNSAGVSDVAGAFSVVVRDLANNPISGSSVVADFSGSADGHVCSTQDAGLTVNCAARTVRGATDGTGTVSFKIQGGGAGNGSDIGAKGKFYADGVLIKSFSVGIYDLDGIGGVGTGDLSKWLTDFGSAAYARSDFDGNGAVGPGDLSLWLTVFGAGGSASSCATTCN